MASLRKIEELVASNHGMVYALKSRIERLENEIQHIVAMANENLQLRNRSRELIAENKEMRKENVNERLSNEEMIEDCKMRMEDIRTNIEKT